MENPDLHGVPVVNLHPDVVVNLFGDQESFDDFVDYSLDENDLRIIQQNKNNPKKLLQELKTIKEDVDNTAKDLAME